jgi:hypothetical protein
MAKKKKDNKKIFVLLEEFEEEEMDIEEDVVPFNLVAVTSAVNVECALEKFLEMHNTTHLDLDKNDSYSIYEVKLIKKLNLESKRSFKEL